MRRLKGLIVGAWALVVPAAASACWTEAGERNGVSPHLLYAMAQVESGLKPDALNLAHRARTGTYDIGLMQINSSWLPVLAKFGITERDLFDPCTNIHVGAWILGQCFAREGVSWDCVGAYNTACTQLKGRDCLRSRASYARRVYRQLAKVAR
jgi:soluble lytic murein transglycosylase-like protein